MSRKARNHRSETTTSVLSSSQNKCIHIQISYPIFDTLWMGVDDALSSAVIDIFHQEYVFPVVVIKDPYTWMTSMCRHSYSTNWLHSPHHCPNLVVTDEDTELKKDIGEGYPVPVNVHYSDENITRHESLVGLWNDYYSGWYTDASYPRVIVRFEDLLFHAEEVITKVCHCGGGEVSQIYSFS